MLFHFFLYLLRLEVNLSASSVVSVTMHTVSIYARLSLPCRHRCSYEDTLGPGADCSRWITHLNHRGEELGVDYVWYRNPDSRLGSMEPDWESIVYQV